ncbi:MAG: GAF domain-containing protein [Anaerolineales bacterium]|nr:MAG: GAF domain-containing protein [Anaerolineales bacterium]
MREIAGQDERLLPELAALYEACCGGTYPVSADEIGTALLGTTARLLKSSAAVLCQHDGVGAAQLTAAYGVALPPKRRPSPRSAEIAALLASVDPVEIDGRSAVKALGLPVRKNPFGRAICVAARPGKGASILLCVLRDDDSPFSPTERALARAAAVCALSALDGEPILPQLRDQHRSLLVEAARREQLEDEAGRLDGRLRALREIALELVAGGDSLDALEAIASHAVSLTTASAGAVLLREGDGQVLRSAVAVGSSSMPVGTMLRLDNDQYGRLQRTTQPVVDLALAPGSSESDDEQNDGRTRAAVPIRWGGELLGALVIEGDDPSLGRGQGAEVLELLSAPTAAVLRNAKLLAAEREQRALAEGLAEAASVLSSSLLLEEVLDRILEQVERVVPGDACNVMLVDGGTARIVRERGYHKIAPDERGVGTSVAVGDYPPLARMLQTGEPVVVSDTSTGDAWVREEGQEWLRSYVGAPIRVGDVTMGFLNVDGTRSGQFGADHGRRLRAFAGHAAVAIENALLYSRLEQKKKILDDEVKRRTAEVEAEYAQLEAILDSSSDGFIVADREGSILRTNRVAEGWLTQALSPEEGVSVRNAVREIAQSGVGRHAGLILELTGLDLHLSAARVLGHDDRAGPAVVVALHDVSPLRALGRMKSQFVSNVSHELRTPITTIKLYATLLRDSPRHKWDQYLDSLEHEADRQARLIEDILQIAQVDLGRTELDLAPVALNEAAKAVVDRFAAQAEMKNLRLELESGEDCPAALADSDRVAQILWNLVGNAMRHTDEDGCITVSSSRREADGRVWATLGVRDNGSGIPEDELPHVFDRFFRGREAREMQAPGTGLGLALVKAIVELHGGRVTVESSQGKGASFIVWLPAVESGARVYRQERLAGW